MGFGEAKNANAPKTRWDLFWDLLFHDILKLIPFSDNILPKIFQNTEQKPSQSNSFNWLSDICK